VVYQGQAQRTSLADEIAYLRNYLDLQMLRYGHRCQLDCIWPAGPVDVALPPLLLIMLVENAFKHGVEPVDGLCHIRIDMAVDGRRLHFECVNALPATPVSGPAGLGLANLRRRVPAPPSDGVPAEPFLVLKVDRAQHRFVLAGIEYFEAHGNFVKARTTTGTWLATTTLKKPSAKFDGRLRPDSPMIHRESLENCRKAVSPSRCRKRSGDICRQTLSGSAAVKNGCCVIRFGRLLYRCRFSAESRTWNCFDNPGR
jgi:hypothetical protein